MILMKAIKPKRLKDQDMRLELLNAMRKAGRAIQKDFEKTTRTWEHKPKFEALTSLTGPGPVVLVGTDNLIYKFVDEGTKPHPIFAGVYTGKSNKKTLAFQWGGPGSYTAKTTPRIIGSQAGGQSGEGVLRAYVQHPGIKAREFDLTIQALWRTKFRDDMQAAMKQAAERSGHAA